MREIKIFWTEWKLNRSEFKGWKLSSLLRNVLLEKKAKMQKLPPPLSQKKNKLNPKQGEKEKTKNRN